MEKGTTGRASRAQAAAAVALLALLALACRSIGGTFDHSRSLTRAGGIAGPGAIAVVGPPETAEFLGLAEALGTRVGRELSAELPGRQVLDQETFYARLERSPGTLAHFGSWLTRYAQTSILDRRPMPAYGRASGARYLLWLRDAQVDRERMDVRTAAAASGCRTGCMVGDASNIWSHRITVIAEVHDLARGKLAWKGVGEASAITSRMSKLDFGLVQVHMRQAEADSLSARLITHASMGLVRELAASATP